MPFTNPVIGGQNTLIRTAIRSPNYVAGVSGWTINKDGTAEFNNVTVRGAFVSGPVLINSGGVKVTGSAGSAEMNTTAQFLARRVAADGTEAQMGTVASPSKFGGIVLLRPKSPTANGNTLNSGFLYAYNDDGVAVDRPEMSIQGAKVAGLATGVIRARGQRSTSVVDDSQIDLDAAIVLVNQNNLVDSLGHQYVRQENGDLLISFPSAVQGIQSVTFAIAFATVPRVTTNIDSGAGPTARWCSRAINVTTTGFDYFVFSAPAVAAIWTNIPCSWTATARTP